MKQRYLSSPGILAGLLLFSVMVLVSCTYLDSHGADPITESQPDDPLSVIHIPASDNSIYDNEVFHSIHGGSILSCSECHTGHLEEIVKEFPATCIECHTGIKDVHMAHYPFEVVYCTDCHPYKSKEYLDTDDCLVCHGDLNNHPYIYECLDCHGVK